MQERPSVPVEELPDPAPTPPPRQAPDWHAWLLNAQAIQNNSKSLWKRMGDSRLGPLARKEWPVTAARVEVTIRTLVEVSQELERFREAHRAVCQSTTDALLAIGADVHSEPDADGVYWNGHQPREVLELIEMLRRSDFLPRLADAPLAVCVACAGLGEVGGPPQRCLACYGEGAVTVDLALARSWEIERALNPRADATMCTQGEVLAVAELGADVIPIGRSALAAE